MVKRYIMTAETIRGVFEAGRDYELHWNCMQTYPEDKGISAAFENEVPDWATHFCAERPDENGEPFWSRQEIPK